MPLLSGSVEPIAGRLALRARWEAARWPAMALLLACTALAGFGDDAAAAIRSDGLEAPAVMPPPDAAVVEAPLLRLASHLPTGFYSDGTALVGGSSTGTGTGTGTGTSTATGDTSGTGGTTSSGSSLGLARFSGLPWPSGTACWRADFDGWRGRASDVRVLWLTRTSFESMGSTAGSTWVRSAASRPGTLSIGMGLLTNDTAQRFDDCAKGAFDTHYKSVARKLVDVGAGNAILRLGWESNGASFPWAPRTLDQVEPFKACWRRAVTALRSAGPNLRIEFANKKNSKVVGVQQLYPGDAYVDLIGLHFYSKSPDFPDQATWDAYYNAQSLGGPGGVGSYLTFAKDHRKQLAFGEWGISDGQYGGTDNAFFIEKMYQVFRQNAAQIGYEGIFNCANNDPGAFMVYPSENNPKASAKYRELWGAGR